MSLSSNQLDAFIAISKTGSFSKASNLLHISQSALSQKIKILEESLELTLFIRTPSGVTLTEQGEKLLRYCQTRNTLEEELLNDLSFSKDQSYSGVLRVASYSSVLRSVIIPALTGFLKSNPKVRVEFVSSKMSDLPDKLWRAETDFIIMDYELDKSNLETFRLGQEKFVVITSKSKSHAEVFLDNDVNDQATELFFNQQKLAFPKYSRSYFHDCYGIIEGVSQGLGSAVMPVHLVKNNKTVRISKKYKPVNIGVFLHYHRQPFYSKLHKAVIEHLQSNCSKLLN